MKTLACFLLPLALGAAPFRVARVGELDGKVEVQFHAADSWRPAVRNTPLVESTWIRTAASGRVEIELDDGSALRLVGDALCELGVCIRAWQHAQQSIVKVLELLRVEPADVIVANQPLEQCLANFSLQLRQIKTSLEQRDFVSLGDTLQYETSDTTQSWFSCIDAVRQLIS